MKARPWSGGSIFHLLNPLCHPGPGSNSPRQERQADRERERGKKEVKKQGSLKTMTHSLLFPLSFGWRMERSSGDGAGGGQVFFFVCMEVYRDVPTRSSITHNHLRKV